MNPAGSRYLAVPGDGRFFSLKLSTSFDTDVPAEVLFDRIVDFDWLAHRIMRNGGHVSRIDPTREPGIGLGWNIGFLRNRKAQSVRVKIEQFDRPAAISVSAQSKTLEALMLATVISMDHFRARLVTRTIIRPRNIRAAVMVQLAKIRRTQLNSRFDEMVMILIKEMMNEHKTMGCV
ncbi:hypothetical protein Q0601_20765 [Paracoccus onubensis]|uniref:hypothetical protein n=1 Tax=Paracoccus onubensis TaxID=1675788 RepID=UPI00272FB816|nr:hypothetical protein [Paracoccus onubensis]MDP0929624.1 hypothetical protein [Paracoccus onubensis]